MESVNLEPSIPRGSYCTPHEHSQIHREQTLKTYEPSSTPQRASFTPQRASFTPQMPSSFTHGASTSYQPLSNFKELDEEKSVNG